MFSADPSQLQHELSENLPAPYPPSIAISRSQARRLIESCELAEMSLASIGGDDSKISPYILVIEMALLIRLGEYVNAHHLWERSRRWDSSVASSSVVSATKQEDTEDATKEEKKAENRNDSTSVEESVYLQLDSLWNAARYCYMWSTGGMYPFNDKLTSSRPIEMQVENAESNANLPYSTLALQALQSCASSKMQPLTTYAEELIDIFRHRVNEGMHRSFGKIKVNEYRLRMNQGADENFSKYGWVLDSLCSEHLVSDSEWEPDLMDSSTLDDSQFVPQLKHEDVLVHQLSSNGQRVRQLANAVMFLEQTKMNA